MDEEAEEIENPQEAKKTLADYLGLFDNWQWQLSLFVLGFLGIWSYNPNEKESCSGSLVEYRGREYCLNTPQDSLTYLEHVICDTVPSLNSEIDKLGRLIFKNTHYFDYIMTSFGLEGNEDKRSLSRYSSFYNDSDSITLDSFILVVNEIESKRRLIRNYISRSKKLIHQYQLDSSSFYLNIGKAYWNMSVFYYNGIKGYRACAYFTKLQQWGWRDSVITKEERDLMAKICDLRTDVQPTNPESERSGSTTNNNVQDSPSPPPSEEAEWAKAIAADNAEAYALYLERFPNGTNAVEARKRISDFVSRSELNAWDRAKQQDNVASYESYLKAYPNGVYAVMARQRINDLLDNAAWSEAQKTNTPAACRRYLNEFPNGLYREEALKCINPPIAEFKVSEDLKSNVVGIRATLATGSTDSGSGLIVGKKNQQLYIVTPGYLIHEGTNAARQIQVSVYKSSRTYLAKEVAWFQNDDLSVLTLTEPNGFTWKSNSMDYTPRRSQKIRYIKAVESWTDLEGEIVAIDENKIEVTASNRGTAGSPVINEKGIIGLIQTTDVENTCQALSINRIRELLGNDFVSPIKEPRYLCDDSLEPADNPSLGYKNYGNRCEGYYRSRVSSSSLELVSCTLGDLRFKNDAAEVITLSLLPTVNKEQVQIGSP